MSAFAQIQAVINEEELVSDQLRILAKDARGLTAPERDAIVNGAALIENLLAQHHVLFQRLCEAQQQIAATGDRLREVESGYAARVADLNKAYGLVFPTLSARLVPFMARMGR